MTDCHTYLPTIIFSLYSLDPHTPETDYEIHLIKANLPDYVPPDNEAWPLYYQVVIETLNEYPDARQAVFEAVSAFCQKIKGRRALLPLPPHSPHRPNEPNPLPSLPDLGTRTPQ